jgi:hypothetical protein
MNQPSIQHRIPRSIPQASGLFSSYLDQHFPKAFIWSIQTVVDVSGQFVYKVELSDALNLYHLKFNLEGNLLGKQVEAMI